MHVPSAQCQLCSDIEVILVMCTSDLNIQGFIPYMAYKDVTHMPEQQALVIYLPVSRLHWKEK